MSELRARRRDRVFPDVPTALLLTIGSLVAGGFIGFLALDLGTLAATAIGTVVGVGGVATLAARRVAEPQAVRLGLVGLDWRVVPVLLALVPAALLAKELDNLAVRWSPPIAAEADAADAREADPAAANTADTAARAEANAPATGNVAPPPEPAPLEADTPPTTADAPAIPDARTAPGAAGREPSSEGPKDGAPTDDAAPAARGPGTSGEEPLLEPLIDPSNPYSLMEALIFFVGIEPVIHEFLFRGVIQQGLVAQLGLYRGVTLTSLLWTMLQPVPAMSAARFAAAFLSWFALGWLLGMVRAATGSILGSILLTALWSAVGLASIALTERAQIPGISIEGTHLPLEVTLLSAILVGVGAWRLVTLARLARGA